MKEVTSCNAIFLDNFELYSEFFFIKLINLKNYKSQSY